MPNIVDTDMTRRQRGRRRSYSTVQFINRSLETGKGLYFTAEELQNDYNVKAQAFASAIRSDADLLNQSRDDGQLVKVFTRPYTRNEAHAQENEVDVLKDESSSVGYLQDLEFKAYLEAVKGTESPANATEEGSSEEDEGSTRKRK